MAISIRQCAVANTVSSITSVTATFDLVIQSTSIIAVMGFSTEEATTLTFSDSAADAYTDSGIGLITDPGFVLMRYGMFLTPTVGVTSVTATVNNPIGALEVVGYEITGFTGTPTLDKKPTAHSLTGTAADSGSTGTLSAAVEACVCYVLAGNGATTAGSGWSTGGTNFHDGITPTVSNLVERQVTAATTAINGTGTVNSGEWRSTVLTFYDAIGGGPAPILMPQILL